MCIYCCFRTNTREPFHKNESEVCTPIDNFRFFFLFCFILYCTTKKKIYIYLYIQRSYAIRASIAGRFVTLLPLAIRQNEFRIK